MRLSSMSTMTRVSLARWRENPPNFGPWLLPTGNKSHDVGETKD